jgi:hypothetical protein
MPFLFSFLQDQYISAHVSDVLFLHHPQRNEVLRRSVFKYEYIWSQSVECLKQLGNLFGHHYVLMMEYFTLAGENVFPFSLAKTQYEHLIRFRGLHSPPSPQSAA